MFQKWMNLAKDILSSDYHLLSDATCPNCESSRIEYQFVGNTVDRIGYLDLWCDDCLNGIHISRVKAPEDAPLIPFGDIESISGRIPSYKQITP